MFTGAASGSGRGLAREVGRRQDMRSLWQDALRPGIAKGA